MSVKDIRLFGDPILRTPATEVVDFDKELRQLVADLTDTELVRVQSWEPGQINDEVLDRVKSALSKRGDRIDSPREHLRPAAQALGYPRVSERSMTGLSW